jgi:hypothetical protein
MISVIRSNQKAGAIYEIPVKYQCQTVAVGRASSLDEAIQKVLRCEHKLPDNYIDGTLEIDYDVLEGGSA